MDRMNIMDQMDLMDLMYLLKLNNIKCTKNTLKYTKMLNKTKLKISYNKIDKFQIDLI
jgi:hypothetical protein